MLLYKFWEFSTSKVDIFINYLELLIIILLLLGIIFIRRLQPIFMVGRLILIILIYSYLINMFLGRYWFRYALVLVMLRGVLVVFTYIVSLIPNERFENYNIIYVVGIILLIIRGYYLYIYINNCRIYSTILWSSYISIFNIFIVIFLLIIILVVVWFRYIGFGALRIN